MQGVLFASDLHLSGLRPDRAALAVELLRLARGRASRVYLLGDLVEFWLGDDDPDPIHRALVDTLASLTRAGAGLHVARGNRDFLLGERFRAETGAAFLNDFEEIDVFGTAVLVTHGDLLCVKDTQYQQFRHFVRNPKNQAEFLARPLDERRSIASRTRTGTQASMLEKDEFIMDADADEVTRVMRAHGVRTLIHGHTHRPGDHRWDQDGVPMRRIVLGDWYGGNEVLWWTPEGGRLVSAEALIAGFNA